MRDEISRKLPDLPLRLLYEQSDVAGSSLGMMLNSEQHALHFMESMNAENIPLFRLYGGSPLYKHVIFTNKRTAEKNNFPYNYPFIKKWDDFNSVCPQASLFVPRMLFLPITPDLTENEVEVAVQALVSVFQSLFR